MNHRFRWTILILLVALLGGAWIAVNRETVLEFAGVPNLTEAPLAGYLAPDFTLQTIQGESVALSELRGRPVVVNFWATWCPPCRAEMPDFQAVHQDFSGRAVLLGVNQGESAQDITSYAAEVGITYPMLVDADSQINQAYGIRALPTTIFIDANGVVREVYSGILNKAILESRVNNLLKEQATGAANP